MFSTPLISCSSGRGHGLGDHAEDWRRDTGRGRRRVGGTTSGYFGDGKLEGGDGAPARGSRFESTPAKMGRSMKKRASFIWAILAGRAGGARVGRTPWTRPSGADLGARAGPAAGPRTTTRPRRKRLSRINAAGRPPEGPSLNRLVLRPAVRLPPPRRSGESWNRSRWRGPRRAGTSRLQVVREPHPGEETVRERRPSVVPPPRRGPFKVPVAGSTRLSMKPMAARCRMGPLLREADQGHAAAGIAAGAGPWISSTST